MLTSNPDATDIDTYKIDQKVLLGRNNHLSELFQIAKTASLKQFNIIIS